MRPLLILSLLVLTVHGWWSPTSPYDDIRGPVVHGKIVQALLENETCIHLLSLPADSVSLNGGSPVLDAVRQDYPAPFFIRVNDTDVCLCWRVQQPPDSTKVLEMIIGIIIIMFLMLKLMLPGT